MKAVDIRDLSLTYYRQPVLKSITLSIEEGDYFAFIGPNGGGKTSLAKLIAGLLSPTSGSIHVFGKKVDESPYTIGYVPQHTDFSLDIPITVEDIVLQSKIKAFKIFYTKEDKKEAYEALERVGMREYASRKISDLSGGQRQRVLIARALATNPKLLILDEPTSDIDIPGQKEIYSLLNALPVTKIIISHDINVLLEGVNKVAFINKTLHLHNTPDLGAVKTGNGHFCEVELINYLKNSRA